MKKAFTMIELVFAIVVIGILAASIIPNSRTNPLQEAAIQVLSHIRYTQHLAMIDDKYDVGDSEWYKERWQIMFSNTVGSGNRWSYMIFSDSATHTGSPDIAEHARNPLDNTKYMSGGYSTGNISSSSELATKELNIGSKYGVDDVDFIDGCSIATNRQRIFFDHAGRPFYGGPHLQTAAYKDGSSSKILKNICHIELCVGTCTSASSDDKVVIKLEAETGFACILNADGKCI